jgi:hypothetical protein
VNESDFLKNFAKVLGAETKFEEIEEKRLKEKRMLESLGARFGIGLKEEVVKEVPATLLQQPEPEIVFEPDPVVIELEVPSLTEEVVEPIVESVIPPLPQLPVDTIVSKSVEMISKAVDTQAAVDKIDDPLRREIEAMKKSIADFHRFATRHSQMGGGGAGDVISLDHQTTTVYGNHVIGRHDYYVGVGVTPATITLPSQAKHGRVLIIKDEVGNSATNPITVLGNVDNDAGGFILAENNGGIQMIYNNGGWRII